MIFLLISQGFRDHYLKDESGKRKKKFTAGGQITVLLFGSWFNILLVFVPAGFAVNYTKGSSLPTFLVNFFAIVPLSMQAEYAIAELRLRIGENLGGLAYITIR